MEPILTQEETEAVYSALKEANIGMAEVEEIVLVDSREYLTQIKNEWSRSAKEIKSGVERALSGGLGKRITLEIHETKLVETKNESEQPAEQNQETPMPSAEAAQVIDKVISIGDTRLIVEVDRLLARRYLERRMGVQSGVGEIGDESSQFTILEHRILSELLVELAIAAAVIIPQAGEVNVIEEEVADFVKKRKPAVPWFEMRFTTLQAPAMSVALRGPHGVFTKKIVGASKLIANRVTNTNVAISVELGRTKMRVSDLVSMKPGTFIPLNVAMGDSFSILVDGVPKLKGEPMISRGNISVRVLDRIKSGESENGWSRQPKQK